MLDYTRFERANLLLGTRADLRDLKSDERRTRGCRKKIRDGHVAHLGGVCVRHDEPGSVGLNGCARYEQSVRTVQTF